MDEVLPAHAPSLVEAAALAANGEPGRPFGGVGALLLVSLLGPVGAAAWLASVRQDASRFLRREIALSVVVVPVLSVVTLGLVGAIWRVVVLAPLVEELQTRAGLPHASVSRTRYALPFAHALFVQEDLASAWLAARTLDAGEGLPLSPDRA
jgi:hypothetical protein